MDEYELMIKRLEQERESYIVQRDSAIAEIAKREKVIEGLRQLARPMQAKAELSLPPAFVSSPPPVSIAERKASWIPQPVDSYEKRREPSRKIKAVAPPPEPDHGRRPEGAGADWISLIASQASPFALALSYLRTAPSPFTSAQLNAALVELRGIRGGAGYTTLDPLQKAGVIEGANNVWNILDRSRGGIVANGFLWSSPNHLNIYDWACIRREAVILVLQEHPEGLRSAVITKTLMHCKWLRSPVDPHLIKGDLRQLEAKHIAQQNAAEKTWTLTTRPAASPAQAMVVVQ